MPFSRATGQDPVMLVLCSENYAAASLVARCEPAIVFQSLGGARDPTDQAMRATFAYAIMNHRVHDVVVCGHEGCHATARWELDSERPPYAVVVSQCVALRRDDYIGSLLRDHDIALHATWFDRFDVEHPVKLADMDLQ